VPKIATALGLAVINRELEIDMNLRQMYDEDAENSIEIEEQNGDPRAAWRIAVDAEHYFTAELPSEYYAKKYELEKERLEKLI